MELQSVSFSSSVSLQAIKEGSSALSSAEKLPSRSLLSPQKLELGDAKAALPASRTESIEPTSVVTQLVAGPAAAAALYGEIVSTSSANSVPTNTKPSEAAGNAVVKSSEKLAAKVDSEQAELALVKQLASRDREVKAHEQTHAAIGGNFAGAPTFDYTSGPDGRLYATSGEVSIDTSAVADDPRATLEKAQVIIRAALSVSEPSSADRQVAAEAKSLALRAMSELREVSSQDSTSTSIDDPKSSQVDVVEQQRLEREEYLVEEQLKQAKQERNEALAETRRQSNDASIEVLKEYNKEIFEIQEKLRQLNVQLVDSGAFQKLFPEGGVIDQSV